MMHFTVSIAENNYSSDIHTELECYVCDKEYHVCELCDNEEEKPWEFFVCSMECFAIHCSRALKAQYKRPRNAKAYTETGS